MMRSLATADFVVEASPPTVFNGNGRETLDDGGSRGIRMRYAADLTAGSLKVPESRIVAGLLLDGVDRLGWKDAIENENVLQARNTVTAKRLARLIRQRLETMDADLWKLVRDGTGSVATHAVLAAAVKHSPLLGDFLDLVVREKFRVFDPKLTPAAWEDYLNDCRGRDPDMPLWTEITRRRLKSSVFQTLAQAGFLENTKTLKLQPVHIARPVIDYLQDHDESYFLRCTQVSP
jgi:Putative inner membrane protein (DUF1819)